MADRDQPEEDRLTRVQRMSPQERQEAIDAGVVEDIATAPPEYRAFAEHATQRFLAAFSHD